ncbi:MAG: hypothetical protein MR270_07570 [Erysipelotrichaceae bacterium]|nr:hypothetical protein [Erysipelotrichaceae bacterium]
MKKIIDKSYRCLIFIFFVLYLLVIRIDANEKSLFFNIGLIVGAIVIALIPFFTNKCKKVESRRWYLVSIISLSAFCIFQAIYFIVFDNAKGDLKTFEEISKWVLVVSQALFICFTGCTIIYTIKDYFKKNYSLQKFDLDAIMMICNLLSFIFVIYLLFDFSNYEINPIINAITFETSYLINYGSFDIIWQGMLILSCIYIFIYVTIELIKYYKFEKDDDKSNNIYK